MTSMTRRRRRVQHRLIARLRRGEAIALEDIYNYRLESRFSYVPVGILRFYGSRSAMHDGLRLTKYKNSRIVT